MPTKALRLIPCYTTALIVTSRLGGYYRGMVQHGTPVPPSRQLAAILREMIESGKIQPGEKLPSIMTLASEHGVATGTVRKAIAILKDEGLAETVPGYGTFAASRPG